MSELLRLDAMALALIARDVVTLGEADLTAPTPCAGWDVADLIRHMNERHEAVVASILPTAADLSGDPREVFAHVCARWVAAVEQSGEIVVLPQAGPLAAEQVLAVHLVDMLTHRWDIARALRRDCPVPARLLETALPIARSITAPGSRLNGPGGVYSARLAEDESRPVLDTVVALLGRDPRWRG
ncbi:maleylpyruvate isomerase family mycothiol-dependent enzyme [Nocardia spumae]|uniref:maleylpyruvate isomerase family mycothiol-dependent enzyme n=1 Tax=Nocardia spumae TaxID=2887190 RepID=UPI001D136BA9|nr:maleylpyruvate isomerase family mycothiol-dependent enzyme [Nocardia spumae]